MDNQRLFLYGALGLLILVIWQTWQADYGSRPQAQPPAAESGATGREATASEDVPDAPVDADTTPSAEVDDGEAPAADAPDAPAGGGLLPRGFRKVDRLTLAE